MTKLFLNLLVLSFTCNALAEDPLLLKNFREIYASYAAITNIDPKSPDLLELYKANKDRLPASGLPSELSSPVVLALTELSGAFCKKALDREKALKPGERILFPNVNFKVGPSQFQKFRKTEISQHLAQLFWQREATDKELNSLSKHIDRLGSSQPYNPAETEQLLHILCTTYGTSLAFLVK